MMTIHTPLLAAIAAGLAARLEAGLNWDLTDLRMEGDELVGVRPALGDTVLVEVGWSSTPRVALHAEGLDAGHAVPGVVAKLPRPVHR